MVSQLEGRRVAILASSGVEEASRIPVDRKVAEASVDDYDALLLPGGTTNPDHLRQDPDAVGFVRDFFATGKPVGVICHGSWTRVWSPAAVRAVGTWSLTSGWTVHGWEASTSRATRHSPRAPLTSPPRRWPTTPSPAAQFYGIQGSNHGRVVVFAGGIPLQRNGTIVGAAGVSGGDGQQDQTVAEAAAAAL